MRLGAAIALFLLLPGTLPAQGRAAAGAATPSWTGRAVTLARVNGRAMAPACPTRAQIDHFVRVRALKWDDASLGCRFMLAGNFSGAAVVEEWGDYLRVTFVGTSHATEPTYWVPRSSFRLVR